MGIKKVAKTSAVLELGKNSVVLLGLWFCSSPSKPLCVNDVFSHVKTRQSSSLGAKPLRPTDNVTASLASYKTTFYLQNLHNLAILFFLTKITKLAFFFTYKNYPVSRPIFELRDRDHYGSRPRPVRNSRDQDRDRDHKKLVSRPTALTGMLEAKDQGHSRKCSPKKKKKRSSKQFFRQSPIFRRNQNF